MNDDVNQISIKVRIVAPPERKVTKTGKVMTTVRVVRSGAKNQDGTYKPSLFLRTVTFGDAAEDIAAHAQKGDVVIVSGKLVYDEWTNDAGEKKPSVEILFAEFDLVERKGDAAGPRRSSDPSPSEPVGDDEIPF